MKFHDAHCHLSSKSFQKDFNLEETIPEWKNLGMECVIGVSTKYSESVSVLELARQYDCVIPGIGIHPWSAKKPLTEEIKEQFNKLFLMNTQCVVGEIGLDYHFIKKEERYSYQEQYFRYFLEIAESRSLPVNIHLKGAEKEVADILLSYKIPPNNILIHWYSGSPKILRQFVEREYFFTINPSVLSGSAHRFVLEEFSINNILTESDGNVKYTISDERIIGSPGIIPLVIDKIVEETKYSLEEIADILHQNFNTYTNIG